MGDVIRKEISEISELIRITLNSNRI